VENTDSIGQDIFEASTIENSELSLEKICSTKRKVSEALASDVRSSKKSRVSNSVENTDSIHQEISGATTPKKSEIELEMIGSSNQRIEWDTRESKDNSDKLSVISIEQENDEGNREINVVKNRSIKKIAQEPFFQTLSELCFEFSVLKKIDPHLKPYDNDAFQNLSHKFYNEVHPVFMGRRKPLISTRKCCLEALKQVLKHRR
jgi:hypothetical protein